MKSYSVFVMHGKFLLLTMTMTVNLSTSRINHADTLIQPRLKILPHNRAP